MLAVAHADYLTRGWPMVAGMLRDGMGVVMDVKSCLEPAARPADVELWRL